MAGQLKLRRGTTSQLANYIGSQGELTYDTTLKSLVLHDGVTKGGVKIPYLSNGLVPSAMLPTATESVVGTSKIATTAIAQAGVNDTDIVTPLKLQQKLTSSAFGVGQTWQDVTGSRAQSTNYINNTGKIIFVNIYSTTYGDSSSEVTLTVGGLVVGQNITRFGNAVKIAFVCAPVPHGQTYSMSWNGTASIKELR